MRRQIDSYCVHTWMSIEWVDRPTDICAHLSEKWLACLIVPDRHLSSTLIRQSWCMNKEWLRRYYLYYLHHYHHRNVFYDDEGKGSWKNREHQSREGVLSTLLISPGWQWWRHSLSTSSSWGTEDATKTPHLQLINDLRNSLSFHPKPWLPS